MLSAFRCKLKTKIFSGYQTYIFFPTCPSIVLLWTYGALQVFMDRLIDWCCSSFTFWQT